MGAQQNSSGSASQQPLPNRWARTRHPQNGRTESIASYIPPHRRITTDVDHKPVARSVLPAKNQSTNDPIKPITLTDGLGKLASQHVKSASVYPSTKQSITSSGEHSGSQEGKLPSLNTVSTHWTLPSSTEKLRTHKGTLKCANTSLAFSASSRRNIVGEKDPCITIDNKEKKRTANPPKSNDLHIKSHMTSTKLFPASPLRTIVGQKQPDEMFYKAITTNMETETVVTESKRSNLVCTSKVSGLQVPHVVDSVPTTFLQSEHYKAASELKQPRSSSKLFIEGSSKEVQALETKEKSRVLPSVAHLTHKLLAGAEKKTALLASTLRSSLVTASLRTKVPGIKSVVKELNQLSKKTLHSSQKATKLNQADPLVPIRDITSGKGVLKNALLKDSAFAGTNKKSGTEQPHTITTPEVEPSIPNAEMVPPIITTDNVPCVDIADSDNLIQTTIPEDDASVGDRESLCPPRNKKANLLVAMSGTLSSTATTVVAPSVSDTQRIISTNKKEASVSVSATDRAISLTTIKVDSPVAKPEKSCSMTTEKADVFVAANETIPSTNSIKLDPSVSETKEPPFTSTMKPCSSVIDTELLPSTTVTELDSAGDSSNASCQLVSSSPEGQETPTVETAPLIGPAGMRKRRRRQWQASRKAAALHQKLNDMHLLSKNKENEPGTPVIPDQQDQDAVSKAGSTHKEKCVNNCEDDPLNSENSFSKPSCITESGSNIVSTDTHRNVKIKLSQEVLSDLLQMMKKLNDSSDACIVAGIYRPPSMITQFWT